MTQGPEPGAPFLIGVIADTHGELPDAACRALAGVGAIVHAGDAGGGLVVEMLETIAPVTLVRGNNRYASETRAPLVVSVVLGGVRVVVAHRESDLVGSLAGARVAVTGHTHVGLVEERDDVLWVNPGSPLVPRRGAPASVAIIAVAHDGTVSARLVPLT